MLGSEELTADLSVLNVDELKVQLRSAGLPVSGRKQELIDRLLAGPAVAASENDGDDEAASAPAAPASAPALAPLPEGAAAASLEDHVVEALWRANSRPLIRIGSKGVKQSHRNSLSELLAFHGVVCVKMNVGGNSARDGAVGGVDEARVLAAAAAEMLRDQPDVVLVTIKERAALFARKALLDEYLG